MQLYQITGIYLVAHAGEDLEMCKEVKRRINNNDSVVLIDHVLYSFNYEAFVSNMDFVIASRYHSLIHAYKKSTPAIILGWAEKYEELAKKLIEEVGENIHKLELILL